MSRLILTVLEGGAYGGCRSVFVYILCPEGNMAMTVGRLDASIYILTQKHTFFQGGKITPRCREVSLRHSGPRGIVQKPMGHS